jgi:hypothetical protein
LSLSNELLAYQANVYQDRFFAVEIPFFEFFRYMEAAIHVPVSFWAVRALVKGDHKVPLVLLAYALQTVITTATCMYDFSQWEGVAVEAKWHLASLYGPYLLIGESLLYFFLGGWWGPRDAPRWLGVMSADGYSYIYGCGYVGTG